MASKKHTNNPFIVETVLKVSDHTKSRREYLKAENEKVQTSIVQGSTNKVIGQTALFKYKKVDDDKFTKVFTDKMSKWAGMPSVATSVFEYLVQNLDKNSDEIHLYEQDLVPEIMPRSSYYRGVNWLLKNDFIARHIRTNKYFINPTLFFNGDRLALVEVWEKSSVAEVREKTIEAKQMSLDLFLDDGVEVESLPKIDSKDAFND